MGTVHQDIRAALEVEIAAIPGIPAGVEIAWDNVPFEPTTGQSWIKSVLVPAFARPATRGPQHFTRYSGQLLVVVHTPENEGPAVADAYADAIRDHFTVNNSYAKDGVEVRFEWAERNAGVLDSPWWVVTVTISWYTYSQR